MSDPELRQAIVDEEHLKLLRIGYLVSAGMNALFSLLGLLYVFLGVLMGTMFASMPMRTGPHPPPLFLGWFLGILGLGLFLVMITLAVLKFRAARCLKARRSRGFCMVVAGLSCLGFPYGTVLGVFTFLVLGRASIKALFEPEATP
jgi:hypothetical protein